MKRSALEPVFALLLALPFAGCDNNALPSGLPFSETVADSFAVASAGTLSVEAFVGNVDVRPGGTGMVRVTAVKRARSRSDLRLIDLEMSATSGRVHVVTGNPHQLDNVSVDLTIVAPPDILPGIGLGTGATRYEGRPLAPWWFSIGAGDLTLVLPADVGTTVDLAVGAGSIVSDFPVTGTSTANTAVGTIGSGAVGSITASVGVGTLRLSKP